MFVVIEEVCSKKITTEQLIEIMSFYSGLLALVFLYVIRKRRVARKSGELADDKNVVLSNTIQLNSWDNPGFVEDVDNQDGSVENTVYCSASLSPSAHGKPLCKDNSGFLDVELPDATEDNGDLRVYKSHLNGDLVSHGGNSLYESNPAHDGVDKTRQDEKYAENHGPVTSDSHEVSAFGNPLYIEKDEAVISPCDGVTTFGNPLYEAFETGRTLKNSALKLTDDVIVDEDV